MIIGTNTRNWYQSDFGSSVELIDAFVSLMEKQTDDAIQKFRMGKQTHVIEEDGGEDYGTLRERVETYEGLDSMSWSLDTVFEEYFPNLQRRSALITVYSFFEHELHKLCLLFHREQKLRLAVKDLSGDGIERSADYLEKVVGLDLQKDCKEWNAATRVREIRNTIVHRDGRLKDAQGNIPMKTKDARRNLKYLTGDDYIVLEKGFVPQAIAIFRTYFKLVDDSIQKSNAPKS